ncbi:hypothetical protein Barb4_03580 [Bacteroidales bacterium Barb4]|nr:hypothetical protein Barb4_03580 [Bacteroidales bacterium Barb4]
MLIPDKGRDIYIYGQTMGKLMLCYLCPLYYQLYTCFDSRKAAKLMLRRCPERARDFSPTCSEECGVNGQCRRGGSERTTEYYRLYLYSPCRTSPMALSLTPHSASLHAGLKSLAPSGHLRNISYNLKKYVTVNLYPRRHGTYSRSVLHLYIYPSRQKMDRSGIKHR